MFEKEFYCFGSDSHITVLFEIANRIRRIDFNKPKSGVLRVREGNWLKVLVLTWLHCHF